MSRKYGTASPFPLDISDEDIYGAMKEIPGYLDITPGDFKELFTHVYHFTLERIAQFSLAVDIMTREVVTVQPETPVNEAASIVAAGRVSGVPVVDNDNRVVGVLSERDFLARMGSGTDAVFMDIVARCLDSRGCAALNIRNKKVADIMSTPAITVTAQTTSVQTAELLKERGINRVPVVDGQNRLLGIISRQDLVRSPLAQ